MWYKNITGRFFGLVTKHACDGQTDGQNYDSQDRASVAASRGKNYVGLGGEPKANDMRARPFAGNRLQRKSTALSKTLVELACVL